MLIGIDWGGTKIEGVAKEADGRELLRLCEVTPRHHYRGCIAVNPHSQLIVTPAFSPPPPVPVSP